MLVVGFGVVEVEVVGGWPPMLVTIAAVLDLQRARSHAVRPSWLWRLLLGV